MIPSLAPLRADRAKARPRAKSSTCPLGAQRSRVASALRDLELTQPAAWGSAAGPSFDDRVLAWLLADDPIA